MGLLEDMLKELEELLEESEDAAGVPLDIKLKKSERIINKIFGLSDNKVLIDPKSGNVKTGLALTSISDCEVQTLSRIKNARKIAAGEKQAAKDIIATDLITIRDRVIPAWRRLARQ